MFPGLNPRALAVQAPACAGEERTHLAKPAQHVSFFLVDLPDATDAERRATGLLLHISEHSQEQLFRLRHLSKAIIPGVYSRQAA